jgi:hypothetical protein
MQMKHKTGDIETAEKRNRPTYEEPEITTYTEAELADSITALGPGLGFTFPNS